LEAVFLEAGAFAEAVLAGDEELGVLVTKLKKESSISTANASLDSPLKRLGCQSPADLMCKRGASRHTTPVR